jgi:hypothetical protein
LFSSKNLTWLPWKCNAMSLVLIPFLGCYILCLWALLPTFWRYMLPPSSEPKCIGWWKVPPKHLPTTRHNNPRMELTAVINHYERLKSVMPCNFIQNWCIWSWKSHLRFRITSRGGRWGFPFRSYFPLWHLNLSNILSLE